MSTKTEYITLTTAEDVADMMADGRKVERRHPDEADIAEWKLLHMVGRPLRCPVRLVSTCLKEGVIFRTEKKPHE